MRQIVVTLGWAGTYKFLILLCIVFLRNVGLKMNMVKNRNFLEIFYNAEAEFKPETRFFAYCEIFQKISLPKKKMKKQLWYFYMFFIWEKCCNGDSFIKNNRSRKGLNFN